MDENAIPHRTVDVDAILNDDTGKYRIGKASSTIREIALKFGCKVNFAAYRLVNEDVTTYPIFCAISTVEICHPLFSRHGGPGSAILLCNTHWPNAKGEPEREMYVNRDVGGNNDGSYTLYSSCETIPFVSDPDWWNEFFKLMYDHCEAVDRMASIREINSSTRSLMHG